jgi:5-(carboxyamino)imidazole ribonucleotide synthase
MNESLTLSPETTIGFLGAGQLARMSAIAALRLGIGISAYAGDGDGFQPLEQMTPHRFTGTFDDEEALIRFAKQCDVVTLENEFLDGDLLARVEKKSGTPIYPSPDTFKKLESKWLEKETFRKAGIPVTPYQKISGTSDLDDFASRHGYPFVLKSSKGGYDGYGNRKVDGPDDHIDAFEGLGGHKGHELIAEAFIPFEKELAVQVARNRYGTAVYPCCETIQINHICKTVISPAPVDTVVRDRACELAVAAVEAVDGTGMFAFEFFMTPDGNLLLNESAPRPHNSGHYTIEGCVTSQFENHIRAVLGLPPGSTELKRPVAVMENLLGTHNRPARVEGAEQLWTVKDAYLHIYGKHTSRIGRKMGHLTLLGDSIFEIRQLAEKLAGGISI